MSTPVIHLASRRRAPFVVDKETIISGFKRRKKNMCFFLDIFHKFCFASVGECVPEQTLAMILESIAAMEDGAGLISLSYFAKT